MSEGEEQKAASSEQQAPETGTSEGFSRAWELVNETIGNGYPIWDSLPWPPEPPRNATNWPSWPSEAVAAYLQALGERQRRFEQEVFRMLGALEQRVGRLDVGRVR